MNKRKEFFSCIIAVFSAPGQNSSDLVDFYDLLDAAGADVHAPGGAGVHSQQHASLPRHRMSWELCFTSGFPPHKMAFR